MRYQLLVLLTALTSQTAFARCRRMARRNPVMAALQNILTSGNSMPVQMRNRRLPVETSMPVNIPLPYIRNVQQKCSCQLEQPCQTVLPEMRVPDILTIQEIRRQEDARIPEIRMPAMITELPKQYIPDMPVASVMISPARFLPEFNDMPLLIRNNPEITNVPVIQERYECPCPLPKALVNPFLPAASPVSAYAPPTSNLLPPATPGLSKNQHLRRIPIPPPTL
ncbi:uncharacterized protein LOC123879111 [Maniola jurtina]|uniref:uncharacterized protein LOC123879111 n=1 Tax=Maniola jurtina TaxID=191418 RepID=UPI001E68C520|nr:uncharacterized protein LOC123879111 [Maniola jurtina]XP_045782609.1 uncharacterized protein LOC123879111 [Maniola jurtina]